MRECKDCKRALDEPEFSSGSNWRQCKKCKSQEVQVRKYVADGRANLVAEWARNPRFEWFVDFLAWKRRWDRRFDVESWPKRPRKPKRPWGHREDLACRLLLTILIACAEELEFKVTEAKRQRRRDYDRAYRQRVPAEERRRRDRAKRARNPELYKALDKANGAKQRQRRAGRTMDAAFVPLNEIWDKTGGMCGICGEACDRDFWHVEHLIALAAGGTHTPENLAPAHPYCNLVKGSKPIDTIDLEWLRRTRVLWEASDACERMQNGRRAPCGTPNRYFAGCRCEACRKARSEYQQKLNSRVRNAPSGTDPIPE